MSIRFTLNGNAVELDVEPEMPLLWAIRDLLKLTGTKFGCGVGLCGACMVHLNRVAVRSCMTTLAQVEGKDVTTIEGLGAVDEHPVQRAWIRNNVSQCGYCQPGQIMSASALLARVAQPTDEDIDRAMSGNLCRCGTYGRIREAIHDAANQATPPEYKVAPRYQENLDS